MSLSYNMRPKLFCNAVVSSFLLIDAFFLRRISVLSIFGVNDQNQNRQQSCTVAISQNVYHHEIFQVCPKTFWGSISCAIGFYESRKRGSFKQLSEKEESVTKRGKCRTWSVTEKLEIGQYAIWHGVTSTLRYFSAKYPELSKHSISDFKMAS